VEQLRRDDRAGAVPSFLRTDWIDQFGADVDQARANFGAFIRAVEPSPQT